MPLAFALSPAGRGWACPVCGGVTFGGEGACREVIIIIWLVSAAGNGGLFAARITLSAIYGDTMEKREGLRSKQRGKKEALYGKGHGG